MELHKIDGGKSSHGAYALSVPDAPRPSYPIEVAQALSYLANLIDESIQLRGIGTGVREWAAGFLRVPVTDMAVAVRQLSPMHSQLLALAFAEDLDAQQPPVAMIGSDQEEAPIWVTLELGEAKPRVPCWLAAAFPGGTLRPHPMVVQVSSPSGAPGLVLTTYTRPQDASSATAYLEELQQRSKRGTNPFRNRTLETVFTRMGLTFRVVDTRATARADVVLPDRIWHAMDRNVKGTFHAVDRLRSAGLATNRGILLAGPPGTGKTALCRALACELQGDVTVVFCDAATIERSVRELYKELVHLAPALVVMEDVDLVVGDRNQGARGALLEFLVALDGAMSDHAGVVTIATTNDVKAIDPAAKRSARFDVVIDVPAPDTIGRAAILDRYLRGLSADVDVARIAGATAGMTGADLRELVSDAVIHASDSSRLGNSDAEESDDVTTALLLRLANERRRRPLPGLYL